MDIHRTKTVDGGIEEGDYNEWSKKWIKEPDNGIASALEIDMLIDDKNDKLTILYTDNNSNYRLAIYKISDFCAVYESPRSSNYLNSYPGMASKRGIQLGSVSFEYKGFSRSLETYLLLLRNDNNTIEVWQGGISALWTANTQTDFGYTSTCDGGGISITGKYILVVMYKTSSPYYQLMLYEGTKV